ncbi:hypothetical protein [Cronobacter sakazakii]|uniref:hypothetical protein n=1 Tax=Cronobacter sakazakii TaxID=28141 RepID=UPI000BEA58EC|nr:hypothetical protein [Cronobacter sakazakii]ELY6402205.1 hypothetical protein [Cronobacter sakazakii]PUV29860.1 hypothetical protein CDT98_14530 [Cronobacter sakazakii]
MKTNAELRLFFWAMFVNMIITVIIGYKYKDPLINFLSPAVYYQAVVFISLITPHIIKYTDRRIRLHKLSKGIEKLKAEIDNEKQQKLDDTTREMFEKIVNTDVTTTETIKSLHDELESLSK